jgi:prephenate dehydratase
MKNTSKKVTFLGPVGTTFSHDAYDRLAVKYGTPQDKSGSSYVPAPINGDVINMVIDHGGYGAIAMETRAGGRVTEPLESFIDLLKRYENNQQCPVHIAGATKLNIHFCLMVRKGMTLKKVSKIVAHAKGLDACKERIAVLGVNTQAVSSNGEAARMIAEMDEYANCAALGPKSAARHYGLEVLEEGFEDAKAVTTFFLLTPTDHPVSIGQDNRMLVVFRIPHRPRSLVNAILPIADEQLNMIQIHSMHVGDGVYDFVMEFDVSRGQMASVDRAMARFEMCAERFLTFGPFEVIEES